MHDTKPVWVTNAHESEADNTIRMYAGSDTSCTFTRGEPQQSYRFSVEELKEKGVVGIYATRKSSG